jgi:cysteine desulfurase
LKFPIYLDYGATTPVDPKVLEEMLPYFTEHFGNAASKSHKFGWVAEQAVEIARFKIASLVGAENRDIIFTSGATESVNLALKGAAEIYRTKGNHIITLPTEHNAVLDSCRSLEEHGFNITYLDVDEYGMADLNQLRDAITDKTILVSIMFANNEIGTIQSIEEIGKICKEKDVLFHTDATQAVGKVPVDVKSMYIDMMSFTAHKMYGPKGVGALYFDRKNPKVKLAEQISGGGHERGFRSGTLNVPGIVGFGKACEICKEIMPEESARLTALRDKMINNFLTRIEKSYLNGHPVKRLSGNVNISFECVESQALITAAKELAVSTVSACTSAKMKPSHVLKAIGRSDELAGCTVRIGIGRFTTDEEVDYAIEKIVTSVNGLREASPAWELYRDSKKMQKVN